ncbi:hypothetical protein AB205_0176790 [Aquarana catesbeiana]|uniref:Uncharacterized protein n=1 Tax=Aquarana catesbeiana TaxID=8400 RepID=A0A2G9Q5F9_AQUCT|nr:hypothetical protein AB205_0176790 [Aquarana catesbeiana]
MLTFINLCASSKFGFSWGDFTPSERKISNTVCKYSCLILPSSSTKCELCKFKICVFLVGFKHACFILNGHFYFF